MQKPMWNFIDNSPVGIFFTDCRGDCSYVNQTWCEITGLSPEQANHETWLKAIHPQDRARCQKTWQEAFAHWQPFETESRYVHNDGSVVLATTQSFPVGQQGDQNSGYLGTTLNLSQQQAYTSPQPKQQEATNRHRVQIGSITSPYLKLLSKEGTNLPSSEEESAPAFAFEAKWLALTTSLPDPVLVLNKNNIITFINTAFDHKKPSAIIGTSLFDLFPQQIHMKHQEAMECILNQIVQKTYSFRYINSQGRSLWLECCLYPIMDNKLCQGATLLVRDITTQAQNNVHANPSNHQHPVTHQCSPTNTASILSTLTNELLYAVGSIGNYSKHCLEQLVSHRLTSSELNNVQQSIVRQTHDIEDTIHSIKQLFTRGPIDKHRHNLNSLIENVSHQLQLSAVESPVTVEYNLDLALPDVFVEQARLEFVITQLIHNALEAIKDTPSPTLTLSTHLKANRVIVNVSDNGAGIPHSDLCLLFEPFFSTKRQGGGINLAICQSIIQEHQGLIKAFNNTPGTGSTVCFSLPTKQHKPSSINPPWAE